MTTGSLACEWPGNQKRRARSPFDCLLGPEALELKKDHMCQGHRSLLTPDHEDELTLIHTNHIGHTIFNILIQHLKLPLIAIIHYNRL